MRRFSLLAATIVLVGGGGILAILVMTAPSPAPSALPGPVEAQAPVAPAAGVPAAPTPPPNVDPALLPRPGLPPPRLQYGPPPVRAPAGTWEAVAPVARAGALGPAGVALHQGLGSLEPRLSECFDEVVQARHGQSPTSAVNEDFASVAEGAATILMLQVETLQDAVRIVDAPVESRGRAGDGLIACAQRVLRGQTFPAAGVKPGARHRLIYQLSQ